VNLFPLDVAVFSLLTALGVPATLDFRRHPKRSHTRLAWWFVSHRTPEPGPVRFFLGTAAAILGWSLHVFAVGVVRLQWRAPGWLVALAAAVAVLCFAALCLNLADELRAQRRERDDAHAAANR